MKHFWKGLLLPKQPEILQNQGGTSLGFKGETAASGEHLVSKMRTGKADAQVNMVVAQHKPQSKENR